MTEITMPTTLHQAFIKLPDPRVRRNRRHSLIEIVILSILAVLSGAASWNAIALFGRTNIDFLRQILENFSTVQKIALNLLKKDRGKESLRSKRLKAGWSKDFLLELIKI
ncbi:MAG: transposase family protein [Prevotellaceae bacterium]|jgi:hypothetical protein|nr:transposase family protein [Prevotellaceae bacterium]